MVNRRLDVADRNSWERKSLVCKGKSIGNDVHHADNIVAAVNSAFWNKKVDGNAMPNGREPRLMTAGMHALTGSAGKRRNGVGHGHEGNSTESRTLSTDPTTGKLSSEKVLNKRINALGVLLEEKIRELRCLDLDKSESGAGVVPRAAILDQLISALSEARAISLKKEDGSAFGLGMQDESCYEGRGPSVCTNSHGPRLDTIQSYQSEAKSIVSARVLHTSDYEQHSPMSILEASFSNDSCLSESFNSSSGHRPHVVLMESSLDKLLPQDLDIDLSDSATSSSFRMVGPVKAPSFLDNFSLMHGMDFGSVGSSGSKNNYFWEVILNAKLLFTNTSLDMHDGAPSPIDAIFLDTLETLVDAFGGGHACNLNYPEDRDGLQFRSFLFDYIIEHLDMKYSHCAKTGYKAWAKMPLLTGDGLTLKIYEEITSCRDQAGEILDEIVQKEMNRTDGEWMYFQVEAFEAGVEMGNDLLQLLVDEILIDLVHC